MVIKGISIVVVGLLAGLILIVGNGMYLSYQDEGSINIISGNSIKETLGGFYETSSLNQRFFVLFQILLLFFLIAVAVAIIKRRKKKRMLSKGDFAGKGKASTDLDTLYGILKQKGQISIDDIGRVFKVNNEIALEWSKVLENGDLAIIDYPRFANPVLKLVDNKDAPKPSKYTNIKMESMEKKVAVKKKAVKHQTQSFKVRKPAVKHPKPRSREAKKAIKKTKKKIEKTKKPTKRSKKLKRKR